MMAYSSPIKHNIVVDKAKEITDMFPLITEIEGD
jgi:hypothetical protein